MEFALGSDPASFTPFQHLAVTGPVDGGIAVELIRVAATDAVQLDFETSASLEAWSPAAAELLAEVRLADDRTRQTWRLAPPSADAPERGFVRLKATLR